MLPQEDYLDLAQALPEGGKGKYEHTCGEGKKLLVEHKPDGYAAWCYRCSEPGWTPKRLSLSERIERLKAREAGDAAIKADIRPPMPPVWDINEWPAHARVWLYKAGFSKAWIEDLGFYWHEKSERVVMPVLNGGSDILFWQARGFGRDTPKYISQPLPKLATKPMFKSIATGAEPCIDLGCLCLTEDILSAARVSQVCTAWSLLGTSLSDEHALEIARQDKPVCIWLDPDEAGRKGRAAVYRKLTAMGVPCRIIRADLDPKLYSQEEIMHYVSQEH